MYRGSKTVLSTIAAAAVLTTAAQAGGFSRGTADTDILYEEGNVSMRIGGAYVAPQRGYETIAGATATDGDYTSSYFVPSAAFKLNLTDSARCAGTYTQPFGANSEYGSQAIQAGINADIADGNIFTPSGTAYTTFETNELGLTCGYKFKAGPGNFWLLGGVFGEAIEYEEAANIGAVAGPQGVLSLEEGYVPGYRLGAAFEIPEIALRVQGLYRSEVTHTLDGVFTIGGIVFNPAAVGSATMPQSFELKAQSGVAPGWLAFGSVKWTDWSVLQTLNYTTLSAQQKDFFYKDGWTVSGGVGHQFNDFLAGSLSLTWDSGVSTTEDVNDDTYTLAGGVSLSDDRGELRFGGGVSYLTGGSVSQAASCQDLNPLTACGTGTGAAFASSVDGDWAYALAASLKINF